MHMKLFRLDPLRFPQPVLCSLDGPHAMAKAQRAGDESIFRWLNRLNDNDPWTLVSAANCLCVFAGKTRRARGELSISMLRGKMRQSRRARWQWGVPTPRSRFMIGGLRRLRSPAADFAGDLNPKRSGLQGPPQLWHLGREEQAAAELDRFFYRRPGSLVRNREPAGTPACDEPLVSSTLPDCKKPESWARLRDGIAGRPAPPVDGPGSIISG